MGKICVYRSKVIASRKQIEREHEELKVLDFAEAAFFGLLFLKEFEFDLIKCVSVILCLPQKLTNSSLNRRSQKIR